MKVFHAADLHYCPKHLSDVDAAFGRAVDIAIEEGCELAIIAGDSFDASMGIHEPAVTAYLRRLKRLANAMPVLVLQGTFSHDRQGSLDMLRLLDPSHRKRITIADECAQINICRTPLGLEWQKNDADGIGPVAATISVLPSLNKADPDIMRDGAAEWVRKQMDEWGWVNARNRASGIATILVTHGTLGGCLTESNFAMVSPDHEFSQDTLRAAECNAVMLGHIHKHQEWRDRTPSGSPCAIVYPGSITRLVFGHNDPCGFVIWDVQHNKAEPTFVPVAGRQLVDITFDGSPDMDDLANLAIGCEAGDHVRIRWTIDQEASHGIDKAAMRELFAHCAQLKLEGTINPIQSVRAGGISRAPTLEGKLGLWCETTGDTGSLPALTDRLDRLRQRKPESIAKAIVEDAA